MRVQANLLILGQRRNISGRANLGTKTEEFLEAQLAHPSHGQSGRTSWRASRAHYVWFSARARQHVARIAAQPQHFHGKADCRETIQNAARNLSTDATEERIAQTLPGSASSQVCGGPCCSYDFNLVNCCFNSLRANYAISGRSLSKLTTAEPTITTPSRVQKLASRSGKAGTADRAHPQPCAVPSQS